LKYLTTRFWLVNPGLEDECAAANPLTSPKPWLTLYYREFNFDEEVRHG